MRTLIFICASLAATAAEFPEAEISNGTVVAKILLPDPEHGSYQGTRFDWSGIISSLQFKVTNILASGMSGTILRSTTRSPDRWRSFLPTMPAWAMKQQSWWNIHSDRRRRGPQAGGKGLSAFCDI